jgi:hypothetical protein
LGYEGGRLRMDDRMDAAMSDMDLVPLLIQVLTYIVSCFLSVSAQRDERSFTFLALIHVELRSSNFC